jgi:hypothetical protein
LAKSDHLSRGIADRRRDRTDALKPITGAF